MRARGYTRSRAVREEGYAAAMNDGRRHDVALAELHLHLYGCIRPAFALEQLCRRRADVTHYLERYEDAYGHAPALDEILARHAAGDPGALARFVRLFTYGDDDAGAFERFQAKFNLLIAGSAFLALDGTPDVEAAALAELDEVARAVLADQRRQGLAYAEQRFLAPYHDVDFSLRALERLAALYARASDDGIAARIAPSLPREDPWPLWERVERLLAGPYGHVVTGVDFCFVEEGHPPREKASFFAAVREHNERHPKRAVAVLYHVGESFTDKSLESAVRWVEEAAALGAHRLGHAIALGVEPSAFGAHEREERVSERRDQLRYDLANHEALERHGVVVDLRAADAELRQILERSDDDTVTLRYDEARLEEVRRRQALSLSRVRSSGAVIEVCPTSNRRIGGIVDPAHHPVHRFLAHGVPLVVSSDDPGIFGIDLAHELSWVSAAAALEPEEARELVASAWRHRSEVLSGREESA